MIIRYEEIEPKHQRVIIGAWVVGRLRERKADCFDFYGVSADDGRQTVQTFDSRSHFEASLQPQPVMPKGYYGEVQMRGSKAVCVRPDGSVAGAALGTILEFQSAFGGLHAHDVGKRIFQRDGVFQMENDDQKTRRLERDAKAVLNF